MNKWFNGVKNSDVGNNCKVSGTRGKIIAVDTAGKYCTIRNNNGTVHEQLRSNVDVSREIKQPVVRQEERTMKQSKTIQLACDYLIKKVRMETAGFKRPGDFISSDEYTTEVKNATKLYFETWVIPVIKMIKSGDLKRIQEFI